MPSLARVSPSLRPGAPRVCKFGAFHAQPISSLFGLTRASRACAYHMVSRLLHTLRPHPNLSWPHPRKKHAVGAVRTYSCESCMPISDCRTECENANTRSRALDGDAHTRAHAQLFLLQARFCGCLGSILSSRVWLLSTLCSPSHGYGPWCVCAYLPACVFLCTRLRDVRN